MPMQPNDGRSANRDEAWPRRDWRNMAGRDMRGEDRDREEYRSDRDRDVGRYDRDRDERRFDRDRDEYRFERDDSRFDRDQREYGRGEHDESRGHGAHDIGGMRGPGDVGGLHGAGYVGGSRGYSMDRPVSDYTGGHRGKAPRNFTRSDERIREIVCEVLTDDDRIDASQIDVDVRNGEVTLNGTVDSRRMKRLAEDIVEDLPGVQDVHNRLRTQSGAGWGSSLRRTDDVDRLNSLLRGELSAVETYRMALEKLDRSSTARGELEICMRSHEERVSVLRNQIRMLGGTPSSSSGPWGVFARLIEGGARVLGDKAAVAALEEGEDHGLKDYRDEVDKLDAQARDLVRSRLLPAQEETHARMSSIKRRM